MKLFKTQNGTWIAIILISSLSVSGCSNSIYDKRISETEESNKVIVEESDDTEGNTEETPAAEIKISEEQIKALEETKIKETPLDAVNNSNLPQREEKGIVNVLEKTAYTDVDEFSQFVSALFYQYHTKQIDGETFYNKLSPHFSDDFKALLPSDKEEQINTFNSLQKAFIGQLKSPIREYQVTNVEVSSRIDEANVYRKYTQVNGEKIYYESVFINKDGRWLLIDDSPALPYEISTKVETKFNEKEGE